MNSDGGSWQRQGKKGRVWVPDGNIVSERGSEEGGAGVGAGPARAPRKPAAKRARKAKG